MAPRGLTVSREQLEQWAGRSLSETEIDRLHACVSHSSIPEAIAEICSSFVHPADQDHRDHR